MSWDFDLLTIIQVNNQARHHGKYGIIVQRRPEDDCYNYGVLLSNIEDGQGHNLNGQLPFRRGWYFMTGEFRTVWNVTKDWKDAEMYVSPSDIHIAKLICHINMPPSSVIQEWHERWDL